MKAWEKLNLKVKIYFIDPSTEITEVLQWSEKDSKIIIIKILQQAPLKQMEKKNKSLRKELEDVKKKWVEFLKLKNMITEIKNLVGGRNSRLEKTEERIRELEDRSYSTWTTEKTDFWKMNRASRISGTIAEDLTLNCQKGRGKSMLKKCSEK